MNNMSVPHSVIHSSNFTNPDEAEDGGRKKDSGDVPKPKVRKVKKECTIGRKPKSANPRNDLLKRGPEKGNGRAGCATLQRPRTIHIMRNIAALRNFV